jgi:hypothetical protein
LAYYVVDCEWDYTWRPEPGSPPYIYVFGNQWWSAEKMPTVEYHMPGATERKYMTGPVAQLPNRHEQWTIPEYVDTTDMDFSWTPDPGEPPYIYQFATQHQKTGGPQYRMPGATEFKYVDMMRAEVKKEAVPIFEIDHLDGAAGQIPDTVKKVRYFDNYRDTLIRLAKSLVGQYEHVWVCSSVFVIIQTLTSHGIQKHGKVPCCMCLHQTKKSLGTHSTCMCLPLLNVQKRKPYWNGIA